MTIHQIPHSWQMLGGNGLLINKSKHPHALGSFPPSSALSGGVDVTRKEYQICALLKDAQILRTTESLVPFVHVGLWSINLLLSTLFGRCVFSVLDP